MHNASTKFEENNDNKGYESTKADNIIPFKIKIAREIVSRCSGRVILV